MMVIETEIEKLTVQFLREHDRDFDKRKKKGVDYPYLSNKQIEIRRSKEIPLSNLSNNQRNQVPQFGDGHDYIEG